MKSAFLSLIILVSSNSFSATLAIDAPERLQLMAMGYDIRKETKESTVTVAEISSGKIVLDKNEERLAVSRSFSRKKLDPKQEYELLQIINIFNNEFSIQFSLYPESVSANLYLYGRHDPKSFAMVVRLLEKIETVFETQPKFYELANK